MEDRGLTWGSPKSRDDTDLIFYPWVSPVVPYISAQILKEHIPTVIVASPKAIDRIREIWAYTDEPYRMVPIVDAFDWFSDVRCWPDFEAHTWVILPSGTALIVNDVCLAGPGRKRQTAYSD
jgi:hypothetical protein